MSKERADGAVPPAVLALVEFVRSLPYGRPSERTVAGMLAERRGTCSTKHRFLFEAIAERFPECRPELVHRVYRVTPVAASAAFGDDAASAVPEEGLTDVHRYLTVEAGGRRIAVDATFPGAPWDGRSPMPLACGPGEDHVVRGDCDAEKRSLERLHCDPAVREPFIAALGRDARPQAVSGRSSSA